MDQRKNLESCLAIVTGMVMLWFFTGWKSLLVAALLIGLTALLVPAGAALISRLWLGVAAILGKIIPVVLLVLIYFLILSPLAWLWRRFRGDPLRLKPGNAASLWVTRDHTYESKDLERPW